MRRAGVFASAFHPMVFEGGSLKKVRKEWEDGWEVVLHLKLGPRPGAKVRGGPYHGGVVLTLDTRAYIQSLQCLTCWGKRPGGKAVQMRSGRCPPQDCPQTSLRSLAFTNLGPRLCCSLCHFLCLFQLFGVELLSRWSLCEFLDFKLSFTRRARLAL